MSNQVSTLVYKYNPKGIGLVIVYIICLTIAFYNSLSMSTLQIGIFGSLFLAVPLYMQYGNSRKLRMMVWDERKLIFSSEGIRFGENYMQFATLKDVLNDWAVAGVNVIIKQQFEDNLIREAMMYFQTPIGSQDS